MGMGKFYGMIILMMLSGFLNVMLMLLVIGICWLNNCFGVVE